MFWMLVTWGKILYSCKEGYEQELNHNFNTFKMIYGIQEK